MDNIEQVFSRTNPTVIDVRTEAEYAMGHVKNSINIPLQRLEQKIEDIRKYDDIVVCCASGGRSQQAKYILDDHGIKAWDGGPWQYVNRFMNN